MIVDSNHRVGKVNKVEQNYLAGPAWAADGTYEPFSVLSAYYFKWYTMEYPMSNLYFLVIHTSL